jgi:GT2 family glycosyltransferase
MKIIDDDNFMISVVIVNYNAGELLTDCVKAVLRSTVPVEVLISDNGSVDTSLDYLRKNIVDSDARVHITENKANLGFSRGNNSVLNQAHGDYLLFLNPDCIIQPDTLEKLLTIMEAAPDIGMITPVIRNTDGTEQRGCRRKMPTPLTAITKNFNMNQEPLPTEPMDVEAISGAFMLVWRAAFEKVGKWDEEYFLHCEDLDLCIRFHLAGYRIVFVPTLSVTHVKGACSQSRPLFVEWHKHKGMMRFYRKFYTDKYSWPAMGMVFVGIWLRFLLVAIRSKLQ